MTGGQLDPTLSQILSELYSVQVQCDRYRQALEEVQEETKRVMARLAERGGEQGAPMPGDDAPRPSIMDGASIDLAMHGQVSDPRAYLCRFGYEPPELDAVADDVPPLAAEINGGTWIAACGCGALGVPSPGGVVWLDRPIIWCPRCENVAAGGRWRRASIPEAAYRAEVEAVLSLRANPNDRNWSPSDTLDDLIRENREHGELVPGG